VPHLLIEDLSVEFRTARGTARALREVGLSIDRAETLAIIGESGSGKSVLARTILGTLVSPPGHVSSGRIQLNGVDLLKLDAESYRKLRGDRVAMVFQDALVAFNPLYQIGWQIAEVFKIHRSLPMKDGFERAIALLGRVGIPNPAERAHAYPHQLSGGTRQRAMIALAVALEPDVLLADEPTTALDVTVQAQIMALLESLRQETGMALILITHDIAVAAEVADRVAVMYAGRIVEEGPAVDVLSRPRHPYTQGLVALVDGGSASEVAIPGLPPDLSELPAGCAFHPRCKFADDVCRMYDPVATSIDEKHVVRCHHVDEAAPYA
jgi:oligopeptide transport system ATP-binding protein